jgi:fatty-acyl-CoA synthase
VDVREQRAEVDRAAKALIAAAVGHGDHVCLWLGNRPELVFSVLRRRQDRRRHGADQHALSAPATWRTSSSQSDATTLIAADRAAGVDYVAMIEEVLPDMRPPAERAISTSVARACAASSCSPKGDPGTSQWSALIARASSAGHAELEQRARAVDPDATAYIMYTSGTTGFPKGVMQGHNVLRNIFDSANRFGVTPNDSILDYLPLYHAFALYTALLLSPATGARHVLMSHFDPGRALALIEEQRITMINGFDTHYKDMLEHPELRKHDLTSLRTGILAAGMHSTEPIARRAQEMFRTMTGYGMTEIGVGVTGSFLDTDEETRVT